MHGWYVSLRVTCYESYTLICQESWMLGFMSECCHIHGSWVLLINVYDKSRELSAGLYVWVMRHESSVMYVTHCHCAHRWNGSWVLYVPWVMWVMCHEWYVMYVTHCHSAHRWNGSWVLYESFESCAMSDMLCMWHIVTAHVGGMGHASFTCVHFIVCV